MIVLDTHIWIWWVQDVDRLSTGHRQRLAAAEKGEGLGISVISCWEVAMLIAKGRLDFAVPAADWVRQALSYPGITLLPLSPEIAVASTALPGQLHADPADRILIATCRQLDVPLVTVDRLISAYPHVKLVSPVSN